MPWERVEWSYLSQYRLDVKHLPIKKEFNTLQLQQKWNKKLNELLYSLRYVYERNKSIQCSWGNAGCMEEEQDNITTHLVLSIQIATMKINVYSFS